MRVLLCLMMTFSLACSDNGTSEADAATASDGTITPDGSLAACANRSGGALITFAVGTLQFQMWITNDAFISEALTLAGQGVKRIPNLLDIVDGTDCDPRWSWHVDPQMVEFADNTIELCDGTPADIENDLSYWLNTVDQFCPWSGEVIAVDDRR
jgi:hypothetical protein